MIVLSKRSFLNILTQLWTPDKLLYANYYMADQKGFSSATMTDNVSFDAQGQLVVNNLLSGATSVSMGQYSIKYGSCLDPAPQCVEYIMGDMDGLTPEERFIDYLNQPDTFMQVYEFLFKSQLEGNGIQILMYSDFENLMRFGDIICQYLSQNFGVDIVFLDAQYNPKCKGSVQYIGNKELGQKTFKDVRDYELLYQFNMALTQSAATNSEANLRVWLSCFSFNDIMYLYSLLFPNDPLPPGNYSIEHITELIIYRAMQSMPKREMPNINYYNDASWEDMISGYKPEEDFGADDGVY